MQGMIAPLTPPPAGLALASKSTKWSVIWRMLGIVVLLYIIAQAGVSILLGMVMDNSLLSFVSALCLIPFLGLFIFVRRPKLTHLIVANPDQAGSNQHPMNDSRVLITPIPTRYNDHLIRDSPPL